MKQERGVVTDVGSRSQMERHIERHMERHMRQRATKLQGERQMHPTAVHQAVQRMRR